MTIPDKLKELIEAEIAKGDAGLLPTLNGVYISNLDILPQRDYPLVLIVRAPSKFPFNGNFIELGRNYSLIVCALDPSIQVAEETCDNLVFNEQSDPPTGLIPFLLANTGITIGDIAYEVSIGETETSVRRDRSGRDTATAEIPITVSTTV